MIRIVFDNGEILDAENINKVYIDEHEMDKVTMVCNIKELEKKYERLSDLGSRETGEEV